MSDELWNELIERARRVPRYAEEHGACPFCLGGATDIFEYDGLGWWARCDPCRATWQIEPGRFVRVRFDADDDEVVLDGETTKELAVLGDDWRYQELLELAAYTRVEPITRPFSEETPMERLTTTPDIHASPEEAINRAERIPLGDASWRQSIEEARAAVQQIDTTARDTICPLRLESTTSDVLADLADYIRPLSPIESAVAPLVALHLIAYECFRTVIRGPRGQAVVTRHARNQRVGQSPEVVAAGEQAALDLFTRSPGATEGTPGLRCCRSSPSRRGAGAPLQTRGR